MIELILPFLMSWFFMTILVDIIAIPTVFRNLSNIKEAGKIGMIVFRKFNFIEIFFAIMIIFGHLSKKEKRILDFILTVFLLVLSMTYFFYLTPAIIKTTMVINQTLPLDPNYAVLQSTHAFYHNLYRNLDAMKLFMLLFFIGIKLFYIFKEKNKELL